MSSMTDPGWCGNLASIVMSDVTPELNQLACELSSLTWDEVTSLAVQLGVEFSTLRQIGQGHHKPNVCALEAMTEWLNNDLDASWNKLISALKTIKKNVLADSLEKKYCSPATDCEFTLVGQL